MSDLSGVLLQHRTRIHEIAVVLARYGFSSLADLATAAAANGQPSTTERLLAKIVDPEIAAMSLGERLCAAFTELGATFVKFGQMLSQRPDIVGSAIAEPLLSLQNGCAAGPAGRVPHRIRARAPDRGDIRRVRPRTARRPRRWSDCAPVVGPDPPTTRPLGSRPWST